MSSTSLEALIAEYGGSISLTELKTLKLKNSKKLENVENSKNINQFVNCTMPFTSADIVSPLSGLSNITRDSSEESSLVSEPDLLEEVKNYEDELRHMDPFKTACTVYFESYFYELKKLSEKQVIPTRINFRSFTKNFNQIEPELVRMIPKRTPKGSIVSAYDIREYYRTRTQSQVDETNELFHFYKDKDSEWFSSGSSEAMRQILSSVPDTKKNEFLFCVTNDVDRSRNSFKGVDTRVKLFDTKFVDWVSFRENVNKKCDRVESFLSEQRSSVNTVYLDTILKDENCIRYDEMESALMAFKLLDAVIANVNLGTSIILRTEMMYSNIMVQLLSLILPMFETYSVVKPDCNGIGNDDMFIVMRKLGRERKDNSRALNTVSKYIDSVIHRDENRLKYTFMLRSIIAEGMLESYYEMLDGFVSVITEYKNLFVRSYNNLVEAVRFYEDSVKDYNMSRCCNMSNNRIAPETPSKNKKEVVYAVIPGDKKNVVVKSGKGSLERKTLEDDLLPIMQDCDKLKVTMYSLRNVLDSSIVIPNFPDVSYRINKHKFSDLVLCYNSIKDRPVLYKTMAKVLNSNLLEHSIALYDEYVKTHFSSYTDLTMKIDDDDFVHYQEEYPERIEARRKDLLLHNHLVCMGDYSHIIHSSKEDLDRFWIENCCKYRGVVIYGVFIDPGAFKLNLIPWSYKRNGNIVYFEEGPFRDKYVFINDLSTINLYYESMGYDVAEINLHSLVNYSYDSGTATHECMKYIKYIFFYEEKRLNIIYGGRQYPYDFLMKDKVLFTHFNKYFSQIPEKLIFTKIFSKSNSFYVYDNCSKYFEPDI